MDKKKEQPKKSHKALVKCPKCKTETNFLICTCGYPLYKDKKK